MSHFHRIFAVACALSAAACVSSSGVTGGSGDATPEEAACASAAKASCDKLASCAPIVLKAGFADAASCAARAALSCAAEISAVEASKTDVARYTTCADKIAATTCGDFLNGKLPAECYPDPGTLAEGKACGGDAQCASTYCKRETDGACGVCAAKSQAGGACAGSAGCAAGLSCAGGTCVALSAADEDCSATQPCGVQLYCEGGKCAPAGKVDDACTGMLDNSCDFYSGAQCNPTTTTCEAMKFSRIGEACGAISGQVVLCGGGASCTGGASAMGTCVARAADGAACDEAKGILCQGGSSCVKSVCAPFDPATCK